MPPRALTLPAVAGNFLSARPLQLWSFVLLLAHAMMRMLVVVLSVIVVVLGVVLDQPWLYAVAGVLILGVIASFAAYFKHRYERQKLRRDVQQPDASKETPAEDDLTSLGIMEIRPKAKGPSRPESPPTVEETEDEMPAGATDASSSGEEHEDVDPRKPERAVEPSRRRRDASISASDSVPEAPALAVRPVTEADMHNRRVLQPFLQALRAALGAHVVCFLKQEEMALDYKIEALVGPPERIAKGRGDVFSTKVPLLTAAMSQRAVTVQRVGEHGLPRESLGYRHRAKEVRQVMLAPVACARESSTCFLLADTTEAGGFNGARPQQVIRRFAGLLNMLLEEGDARRTPDADSRPRREIVAEEMERARGSDEPLALALVYLNEAERIADDGEQAVREAERRLEQRLDAEADDARVVRFGELTFGLFYRGEPVDVEDWATHLEQALAEETGQLDGGISIGIALLHDRHADAEAFRSEATEALREAYNTGTCTILG